MKLSYLLVITVVGLVGCTGEGGSQPRPRSQIEIKQELLKKTPPRDVIPLEPAASFPSADSQERPFLLARSPLYSPEGEIYVVDSLARKILLVEAGLTGVRTLLEDSYETPLENPSRIAAGAPGLFLLAEDGIRRIDPSGEFQDRIRTFLTTYDFAVVPGGDLFLNPLFAEVEPTKPLLVRLNPKGEKTASMGRRSGDRRFEGLDNTAFLAASDQRVYAAFEARPALAVFDSALGERIRQVDVVHPIFNSLQEELPVQRMGAGRIRVPRFLAGIRVLEDSLFVLLHLPVLEVVEYDLSARERRRFGFADAPWIIVDYGGFDVRRDGEGLRFVFSLLDLRSERSILAEFKSRDVLLSADLGKNSSISRASPAR